MNLNKISLIVVVATLVLTGCNNDLVLQSETSEKAIEFVTVMDKTRASLVTEEELTSFFLYAGASGTGDLSFMKVAAYKDDDGWTYAPKKYWPGYDLDFYAYAPIMDFNMKNKPYVENGNKVMFDYEVPDDQSGNNSSVDLLVAYTTGPSGTNDVSLNFKHALSSVIFSAKSNSDKYIFNIHSIKITNLFNKGTYSFVDERWTTNQTTEVDYIAGIPERGVTIYPNDGWLRLLSLNDYLMVLPQVIKDIVEVQVTYTSYNFVEGRIYELEPIVDEYFSLYEVIDEFEVGMRYNFKFELEVNEVSNQIILSVDVDNSVKNDGHDEEVTE